MGKKIIALVLACALLLSLMSITAVAEEKKTVRMWTFLDPTNTTNGRSVALQQIIDKFEAEHPDIQIVVEPQKWAVSLALIPDRHGSCTISTRTS